ncbi:MAG TPA: hypothetical protein VH590_00270 [Ktedonobacterales bacterium]|jgi:uncharacterized membrane protein YccF (DUF307 family)
MSRDVVINEGKSPNIILRFLWFIFIGSWLGYLAVTAAFFLEAIIIGIPLAIYLFDRLPAIMTLKARQRQLDVYEDSKGHLKTREERPQQRNLFIRIIYFLFIGWWLSFFWITGAFALAVTIIGTPIAFWMVDRVPFVASLARV